MTTPAIVPTITQRVRTFLADQGAALRPWSGLQETYDQLYGLLRQRRQDPKFWQPLKGLLREVVASAADSQKGSASSEHAELLASWKVDELVDELRDALPDDVTSARTDFTRSLSTAVLGGFLLLGLAASGCAGGEEDNEVAGTGGALGTGGHVTLVSGTGGAMGTGGKSGTGGATVTLPGTGGAGVGGAFGTGGNAAGGAGGNADAAEAKGIESGTVACGSAMAPELDRAIGQSGLSASQKDQLCRCFGALGKEWTTGLTQLFATATPEEISKMLGGLTSCCYSDGIHNTRGLVTYPSQSDLSNIKNGLSWTYCATPIYKGVSFPER